MIDDNFKKIAIEMQLENIVKLCKGELVKKHIYNSNNREEVLRQIVITYKEDK